MKGKIINDQCKKCGIAIKTTHYRKNQTYCQRCRKKAHNASVRKWRRKVLEKKIKESQGQKRDIGFPTNINYYKPFYKVENGYGYEGVLLCDNKTGEVQCHICGGWFHWLQNHIRGTHKLSADEYRKQFKLNWTTALCSEKVREQLVRRAMTYPWERLKKNGEKLVRMSKNGKNRNSKWRERNHQTLEGKNKLGLCSLQIIERLIRISKKLGRQPYTHEMIGDRGTNIRGAIIRNFGSVAEVRRILAMQGYVYQSRYGRKTFTDQQLLGSLKKFAEVYKRRPSYSDIARGILYSKSTYEKRFGSWRKAKELAFASNNI